VVAPASALRSAAWSGYWSSGAPHSLPGSIAADGGPELQALWRTVFETLPAFARILDVGTGSGIVVRLALAACPQRFTLDAVDLVEAAPPSFPRPPFAEGHAVRFHGGVAAEQLPFEAATFDLAASQFGIEYADPALAGAELRRVLKPGGRIALLVHSVASVAVLHAQAEQPHADWLLGREGLFERAAAVQPYFARASSAEGRAALAGDAAAREARGRFNESAGAADARANVHGGAICGDALALAMGALALSREQPAAGAAALDAARTQVTQAALRSAELVACALDESGAAALAHRVGVDRPEVVEARIAGQPFGFWVTGARTASAGA